MCWGEGDGGVREGSSLIRVDPDRGEVCGESLVGRGVNKVVQTVCCADSELKLCVVQIVC